MTLPGGDEASTFFGLGIINIWGFFLSRNGLKI